MPTASPEQHWPTPDALQPLSLLVHRAGVPGGGEDPIVARFRGNGWLNDWRYPGIYPYAHFHSTTHECLGIARGRMEVELFGHGGLRLRVTAGDVLVLPAGVSHRMVDGRPTSW